MGSWEVGSTMGRALEARGGGTKGVPMGVTNGVAIGVTREIGETKVGTKGVKGAEEAESFPACGSLFAAEFSPMTPLLEKEAEFANGGGWAVGVKGLNSGEAAESVSFAAAAAAAVVFAPVVGCELATGTGLNSLAFGFRRNLEEGEVIETMFSIDFYLFCDFFLINYWKTRAQS